MLKLNMPGYTFNEESVIKHFVFMKFYWKACLRGAIENFYELSHHLTNISERQLEIPGTGLVPSTSMQSFGNADEGHDAKLLKVMKLQR